MTNSLIRDALTPESAYTVESYPYGGYRTQCRWWIETATKGQGKGQQRVCQQTLNPKSGLWNKPHNSTYNDLKYLYLDIDGYCQSIGISSMGGLQSLFAFVKTELYFQLNESEKNLIRDKILKVQLVYNRKSHAEYKRKLEFLREFNPTTVEQFESEYKTKNPEDSLYLPDMKVIFEVHELEKKHNQLVEL